MDALNRADAMVQLWGGLLGIAVMAYFAYSTFFRRKKGTSSGRRPGDTTGEVPGAAASGAEPADPTAAEARSQSLPAPQRKTVSGFAKWWLIFWLVANIGGALAPAGALTNSPVAGLAAAVMLLCAASAVGYWWLLKRKHTGLYVILAANTLGAFLNGVAVPGYSILVTTGLIPAIITYFVTRKQVAYPFGRSRGAAPDETGSLARSEPVQTGDEGARQAALPMPDQPGEADAAPMPLPSEPPSPREDAPAAARPRVALPVAIAGAVVLLVCIVSAIALAGAARTRPNNPAATAAIASSEPALAAARIGGKTATPENTARAVVSPSVQLETKAGPVLIERAELLERFPAGCSTSNPACNAAKEGYQLLVLWLARPGGGKMSEISANLFGEVINYLPASSHDVYVTTADGSEAGLAAAQFPEGEFVLIFGLPQGATGSLQLTWPGNRQLDISGLVQAGASQAPAASSTVSQPPAPRAGHWEGEPAVSFYVDGSGQVRSLELTVPFGMTKCTLTLDELTIGQDGEVIHGKPDGESLAGNFKSTLYVTGRFTGETALAGTYRIGICHQSGDTYTAMDPPAEGVWNAEWKDSSVASTVAALVAPSRTPTRMPTRTPAATATPRPAPTAMPTLAPTIEAGPISLAEALEQQLADIQILGMGAASGASIQVIARATGSQSVSIGIAPGTVLRSSVPGEQDMVVRQLLGLRQGEQRYTPTEVIFLHPAAAEPVTYIVDAYCLNFHKGNPSATTSFSVDAHTAASPDVAAVLAAAGRVPGAAQDIAAIQAAVWTVTDRPTLQELANRGYSPNREMVAALLQSAGLDQACARLFGQACTVPDCPMDPTGQGGTRAGVCVRRLPGVSLAAPATGATLAGGATPTGADTPAHAAAPAATVPSQAAATTTVLDAQIRKLFAPGPDTAGIAITGDAIWVADGEQKRIHRLDRSGAPVSSLQVKAQGEYRGLAWDGEALRLLVHDYQLGSQVIRLDGQGKILSSFTVPADLHALAWNEAGESFWTIAPGSNGFLLEFGAGGELRQTLQVPVFGSMEGLAWAPDGLWVLSGFGKWHRFSFAGEYLASAELPMEVFAKDPTLTWDVDGYLWISVADTREIYQFGIRPAAVDAELPPELRSGSDKRAEGQLPLPRPSFQALPKNTDAVLRVANGLSAPLIVALDSASGDSVHESAVVAPGDTWSAAIAKGGAFTLFASANAAEPVAYFDKILLLAGYEYTWIIGDAVTIAPPPTAAPTARPASPTTVPPTAAPTARSVIPTRAPTRSAPAVPPAAACPDARARITYPANGAAISGVTNFLGTANVPDQAYYKFEYKPASSPTWQYLTQVDGKTVIEDKLMDFFTTTIAPGAYDFRLIVVDRSGNYPSPCEIRLTVRR